MPTTTGKTERADWWSEPKDQVHLILSGVFRTIRDECEWRVDADEYHLGLYCMADKHGVRGISQRNCEYGPTTLPYNLCRSAVDTLRAKIAKQRPLPQVLTQRGNWKNQKRARKMTQFLEGEFYRQRIYEEKAPRIVRDALVFGRGVLKVWTEGRRIKTERRHPWELFVDEWDARYGAPRNIYDCRSIDKGVALEAFARTSSGGWNQRIKQAIDEAGRFDLDDSWQRDGSCTVDRIDVIESYHLCDRPEEHERGEDIEEDNADDEESDDDPKGEPRAQGEQPRKHKCTGRHVIVTTAGTLVDEPWEYDYFPYCVLDYNDAVVGAWGHGLVEQLEGYQFEINMSSERLSEMYHLSGVHIFIPDNAKVLDQQVRNGIHQLRHAPGGKPEVHQMDLVNEHVRARPRELTEDGLNDVGLSQMSVQSQKPAGITSGVALQTLDDVETERFLIFGRAYEAWNVDLGRKLIDCAKQVAAAYGDHAVTVPMKGGFLKLRWTDVYVEGVELRAFSGALLPTQPAARLERLIFLWEKQAIDLDTFFRQLDAPDLQGELDLVTSAKVVIDEALDRMLEAEEEDATDAYIAPTAYQPLDWAAQRANQKYNRALLDGAPEWNLEMLQRYIRHCEHEQNRMTAANTNAAPPMPGAGAPPPVDPMAVPPPAAPMAPPPMPAPPMPGGAPPMAA